MTEIKPRSFLVGLLGRGVAASRSPEIHEAEARAQGLMLTYRLIDFDRLELAASDLPAILQAAEQLGFDGLNVTHPFKQEIIPHLDQLADDAATLNAVNTVLLRDGKRLGFNTDWQGFADSVTRGLSGVDLSRVVQFGAGGAGAATAFAMLTLGVADLAIYDIDPRRAEALTAALRSRFSDRTITAETDVASAMSGSAGVVQATPIGMTSHPGLPFSTELLRAEMWVADVIYFPLETQLLGAARAKGCRTLNGAGMVLSQAAQAFELFTRVTPDRDRMFARFDAASRSSNAKVERC
jgi:shikimate dehydrogenase